MNRREALKKTLLGTLGSVAIVTAQPMVSNAEKMMSMLQDVAAMCGEYMKVLPTLTNEIEIAHIRWLITTLDITIDNLVDMVEELDPGITNRRPW